jgi:capsular exopolysaccharide synthesis family protein
MNPYHQEDLQPVDRLSFGSLSEVIRRRWYVILLCLILVPALTYYVTSNKPKQYKADAELVFGPLAADRGVGDVPSSPQDVDPDRQAATNRDLLSQNSIADRTARALGGSVTSGYVASHVDAIESGTGSNVTALQAQGTDPVQVARLANTYAEQFVLSRRENRRQELMDARDVILKQVDSLKGRTSTAAKDQLRDLRKQASDLDIAAALPGGNVKVLEKAEVPGAPFAPKPLRNTIIGAALGLLLGCLLAVLFETLDRRLRSVPSIETAFDRPILGAIPKSRALSARNSKGGALNPREREAFRMLRANLHYYNDDRNVGSVLVTSATLGEGKSTVAWNLAAAGAVAGSRVLLVEADMRQPVMAERFNLPPDRGLADILSGAAEPSDVIHKVHLSSNGGVNGSGPTMDVVLSGAALPQSVDAIDSDRMATLIRDAEMHYDLVVVDTPPVTVVPDAIPLIRHVDGVILVSRLGTTTREAAERVRSHLDNLGAPTLGIVVNGIEQSDTLYGYAYTAAERRAS